MTRRSRVLAGSIGLAAGGAIAGALAGVAVAALVATVVATSRAALDLGLLAIGAAFGAPLGAVLFPIAGWLLMRRVPLGRALLGTAGGTIAGGWLGGSCQPARMSSAGRSLRASWVLRSRCLCFAAQQPRRDQAPRSVPPNAREEAGRV